MSNKQFQPIVFLFLLVNTFLMLFKFRLLVVANFGLSFLKIDFLLVVNSMLFFIALIHLLFSRKQHSTVNIHASLRSVIMGTTAKMLVFAVAALVYKTKQSAPVGIITLLVSMGLYIVYTWLEIKWAVKRKF